MQARRLFSIVPFLTQSSSPPSDCEREIASTSLDEGGTLGPARDGRRLWLAVAALTLVGLAVRLFAARGALWLDEAWSAMFAKEAATPAGVFFRVNHDNNHFLNTLWLQLVGPGAWPIAQRALSIACGTAAIPLAAAFARRRGTAAALIAALGFAVSPILVTYGAEARGYAPMLLATLTALLIVDRWLETRSRRASLWLTLTALTGMLAQLLMTASLAAIAGWTFLAVRRQRGPDAALRETPALLGGAACAVALVLGVMAFAAHAAPGGFAVGSYEPFAVREWDGAVGIALGWTIGAGNLPALAAAFAAIAAAALLAARRADRRAPFYAIAILAYPLAFVLLRIGNAGMPRYYLLAAVGLLLLLAEIGGTMLARGGWRRAAAGVAIVLFVAGSATLDARIIANRRGDPAAAIAAMRARSPAGATVALDSGRMTPVLTFAARDAGYPLKVREDACADTRFLLLGGTPDSADLARITHCGRHYRQIARASVFGLSGTWWWLFEREK
ncbi:MAG TPA: glycosyltransferase family 39 protein [Sphingomonas sp.]|nr:glycosyltransferase family 39 protein [Sphingomonas sp.]